MKARRETKTDRQRDRQADRQTENVGGIRVKEKAREKT